MEGSIFTGVGSPKPQSRELTGGMFGHVEDAFSSKTLAIGQTDPKSLQRKAQEAAATAAAEEAEKLEEEKKEEEASPQENGSALNDSPSSEGGVNEESAKTVTFDVEHPWADVQEIDKSAQSRIFIKGGRVVNDDQSFDADIYVEDGIIKQLGTNLVIPGGSRTLDAKGKLILPGGIDTHTHFELEFMGTKAIDDFYHGTKAALAGGTTTIIDFVMSPRGNSILDSYEKKRELADRKVCCDYALHVVVNAWTKEVAEEMEILTKKKKVPTATLR